MSNPGPVHDVEQRRLGWMLSAQAKNGDHQVMAVLLRAMVESTPPGQAWTVRDLERLTRFLEVCS